MICSYIYFQEKAIKDQANKDGDDDNKTRRKRKRKDKALKDKTKIKGYTFESFFKFVCDFEYLVIKVKNNFFL